MIKMLEGIAEASSFESCCRLMVHRLKWGMQFYGAAIAEVNSEGKLNELGRYGLPGDGSKYSNLGFLDQGPLSGALRDSTPLVVPDISKVPLHTKLDTSLESSIGGSLVLLPILREGVPVGLVALVGEKTEANITIPAEEARTVQSAISLALRALRGSEARRRDFKNKSLTDREAAVLRQIAAGKTNKEIAPMFNLSVASVKKIVQDILRKLDASNRKEAVEIFFN